MTNTQTAQKQATAKEAIAKFNLRTLTEDTQRIAGKLEEHHKALLVHMKTAARNRGLSTLESALRNSVLHIDRIPEAVGKVNTSTMQVARKNSRLQKPPKLGIRT